MANKMVNKMANKKTPSLHLLSIFFTITDETYKT